MGFESNRPAQGFMKFDKLIKHNTRLYLEEFTHALATGKTGPMQYWKRKLEERILALERFSRIRHSPKHYTGRPQKGRKQYKNKI